MSIQIGTTNSTEHQVGGDEVVSIFLGGTLVYNSMGLLSTSYEARVIADGGTVESVECIDEFTNYAYNWNYDARVRADGGDVEALECVKI